MKKNYSPKWVSSKQPRKQRKYRAHAPLHRRQAMASAHLDKALRKETKKRSAQVRVGDEVVVMRGTFRKKGGKVSLVDLKKLKIQIEGVKVKKISGQEVPASIDPSNVMITRFNMEDKLRMKAGGKKKPKAIKSGVVIQG
ncbi:MAG TPA: 50S ribosomal protein L24 [archaeon]|nr:50S ribosomal protein L24 [archaeon]